MASRMSAPRSPPNVPPAPFCAFVIFGACGDLTRRLIPALYNLAHETLLDAGFSVVGVDRVENGRRAVIGDCTTAALVGRNGSVDWLCWQGRDADARALFERLLSLRNDVGLLAEEYDPRTKRQLGNFPQAFSHLASVGTAMNLHDTGPARRRAQGARPGDVSGARRG